ncbi:hypothetical protein HPB49_004711 [Dermacentor silvarum]|uniref:Uncharacterized protein n=1 Tax=Dermacentor silvarum TaxID=543639 RepID=A0ACB8DV57_DERSI|nr:hypothetical protein HPB49_004711 [Dermacentor silvarum]
MIAQQIAHSSRPSRRPGGPYKDVSGRPLKTSRRTPEVDDDDSCSLSGMEDSALLWNCRGFRSRARAKRANLRLFLSTLDSLPAVIALQEPGSGATLTSYITFQQDPSSCATTEVDNHLLHLWKARHSLVRRWRRKKHNRKLKIRIAELTQRAAEYVAQLADSNWVDRCNTAARQMSSRSPWRLFRDPRGPAYSYAGSENAELDQPFQLHDLKAALAKMKRGTAPGRDKITVKLLAILPDPTYDTLLAFINSIWLGEAPLPV